MFLLSVTSLYCEDNLIQSIKLNNPHLKTRSFWGSGGMQKMFFFVVVVVVYLKYKITKCDDNYLIVIKVVEG